MSSIRKPYVTVTLQGPDDGGDFGPHTPGTKTSGLQEAVHFAHEQYRDLHIWGGRGGLHGGEGLPDNVYTLDEPLYIPWSQDFTLNGGNYVLAYRGETGSAIHIDSQMNCRYKFGLISSSSPDPVVSIRPETPGPDDFTVITASLFDFSAIVSQHPGGASLVLDSSHGPIINSTFFAEETNSTGTGVYLTDAGGEGHPLSNNTLRIPYGNQYHARGDCTGLRLGDTGTKKILHNMFEMSYHAPRGAYFDPDKKAYITMDDYVAKNAIGADIFAQSNILTLSFFGKRQPGEDLIFEAEAKDNTIHALSLPNGITNRAHTPTNKVVYNKAIGFAVDTPGFPSSDAWYVNTTSMTVQVLITSPGNVTTWTLRDAGETVALKPYNLSLADTLNYPPRLLMPDGQAQNQEIKSGLYPGQTFILDPGEAVKFTYDDLPCWRWKAVR